MAGRDSDDGNGRVTMAVLGTKLDTVIAKLDDLTRQQDSDHVRIGVLEGDLRRTNDRVSVWQAGQGALSVVLSALATWLGVRH